MNLGSFGKLSIVYAFLALLLLIELGIMAYLVDRTDGNWWGGSPSQFSFLLFTTVWSILVLLYISITPVVLPSLFVPIVSLGLLALTMLFWFAGSIAMAVLIGVPDCNGSRFCQSAQAGVAFGFFNWIVFLGLTVLEGLGVKRGGSSADKARP